MFLSPPTNRMPSLNALRALEAAARLGSFKKAAEELRVTPGAITAQIKAIEAEYGAKLFERQARGVVLTPLGQRVMPDFTAAFDALGDAVRGLRRHAAPRKVHIATSPALAQLWLGPRLPALRHALSGFEFSVTALDEPPDMKRSQFDICVFYQEPEPDCIRLCDEMVLPVCVPALAKQITGLADLEAVNCIADVVWRDWEIWAKGMGLPRPVAPGGPGFSLYAIALQQALSGAGVLMGRLSLVQPFLDSGALVAPLQAAVPLGLSITLWTLAESQKDRAVRRVVEELQKHASCPSAGSAR